MNNQQATSRLMSTVTSINPLKGKIFRNLLILIIISLFKISATGQVAGVMTLEEAIGIALRQSPDALTAIHHFRSNYWEYRNYRAELMPHLSMAGVLPSLSKDVIVSQEGDRFIPVNYSQYSVDMSLSKNIGLTGGKVSLNSSLQRLDVFADPSTTSYSSIPINIQLTQPLFGFNEFKWRKKTEPLQYNEAQRRYLEEVEQIRINASNVFFGLLNAQIKLKIQQTNLANNDTLYQIAKGRFNIGTIAENELLQIELSLLNARAAVEQAKLDISVSSFNLFSYLRIPEDPNLILLAPDAPNFKPIDAQIAIAFARDNRSEALAFERRIIEAESNVSMAKSENRFSAMLNAAYGLRSKPIYSQLNDIYLDPNELQQLSIGINVPILDWGAGRGKVKLAESQMELERTSIQQNRIDFDQEVFIKVMKFNMQPTQFAIASKSDTVALKRYEVTKQRYYIGKIGITDLNIAQTEKDNAQQSYISALATFWNSYYELRKLTLYDFDANQPINFNIDDIPDLE